MHTIKIKVHDDIYKHTMMFLKGLDSKKVEILEEDDSFEDGFLEKSLKNRFEDMKNGKVSSLEWNEIKIFARD